MKIIGNIIWLVFGGIFIAIEYFISSILLCLTIIGIPFGLQTLKLGILALWPFGGVWIFLSHIGFGILFCITILGIPFGLQHFKLAGLALTPFGHDVK